MNFSDRIQHMAPQIEGLPCNTACEQALLGAILLNNDAFFRVSDAIDASHFFEPIHQKIYEIVSELIRAGKLATPVTLKTFLPSDADIGGMNPSQYLARLCSEATTIINAPDYARTLRDLADRRALIEISEELAAMASDSALGPATHEIIEKTEERLLALTSIETARGGFMRFSDAARQAVDLASKAYQRDGHLSGLPTGLIDLDQLMGGMQNSDLVIIAGRPSMGKTALAANIGYHAAESYRGQPQPDGTVKTVSGAIVGFFSLEMSGEQLATRVLSDIAQLPSSRIRRGDISEHDFTQLASTAQNLQSIPLYIDEAGGLSINQIVSRARRIKKQRGMDLMIVDYIQLLFGSARRDSNRVQEITEITTKLKALAKELDIPILALSQLSREVERRDDKRPQLSDLRDSGSIEQDADVVLFVFRQEYYLKSREPRPGTEEWFKWETALKACENKAEIIVAKQRHGPTGTVALSFEPQYTRFGNLAREDRLPDRRAM